MTSVSVALDLADGPSLSAHLIAEAIGGQLKVPLVGMTAEEAGRHFRFLAVLVAIKNPTSSALTQERLGWRPDGPGRIGDIEEGHYFKR